MRTITKTLIGSIAAAGFALSGVVAVPAVAAPTVTTPPPGGINGAVTLPVSGSYAAKAITLTTDQPMKDGSYAVALGYLTADDSVVTGHLVEIHDGKAKGDGVKLTKDGRLVLTFKLNEFRKYPKQGGMPGGAEHGLKAFPKPGEAEYMLTVFNSSTLTPYATTITFK